MAFSPSVVFTEIKGHVLALDRTTGAELWRTKLQGSEFVNLASDGTYIIAATSGEVFCLDPGTGSLLWQNPMKGLGFGVVSLLAGSDKGNSTAAAESQRRAHARQASAAAQ